MTSSFVELLSKPVGSTTPHIMSWCPTMDLLALSNSVNSLCIHRLSWQRLHNVSVASRKLHLFAWGRSGKHYGTVDEEGRMGVWVTETGTLRKTVAFEEGVSVTGFGWAAKGLSEQERRWESAVKDHFASGEVVMAKDSSIEEPLLYSKSRVDLEPLFEVAIVCLSNNVVELWGMGAVCVGRVSGFSGPVKYAWLTPDFGQLIAIVHQDDTARIVHVPTPILASYAPQVAALTAQLVNVGILCEALAHSVKVAEKMWGRVVASLNGTVMALNKRLEEANTLETLSETLIDVLLCGTRVSGSSLWLETDMGERGAAKLSAAVGEGAQTFLEVLDASLLSVAEQLCFRLEECSSLYTESPHFFGKLVAKNPFEEPLRTCEQFYAQVEVIKVRALAEKEVYMSFCRWLLRTLKLMAYDELIASGDEVKKKEAETALSLQRTASPFDELQVAAFAESISATDGVRDNLAPLLLQLAPLIPMAMANNSATSWMNAVAAEPSGIKTIFDVPVEDLRHACMFSGSDAVVNICLQRGGDDLALLTWDSGRGGASPILSVYDAPAGDIVGVDYFKGGSLCVLCSDSEAGTSTLYMVEDGVETKQRELAGQFHSLAVSRDRGLASVYGGQNHHCKIFDLESDDSPDGDEDADGDDDAEKQQPMDDGDE